MSGARPPEPSAVPGLPVLALHGFTGTGTDFAPLAARAGGPWICPDLPGHGIRAHDPPDAFAPDTWAGHLLPSLPPRLHAVGYSLGGRLLLHLLVRDPGRFASAVLVGVGPELLDPDARAGRRERDALWINQLRSEPLPSFLRAWYAQPVLRSLGEHDSPALRARRRRQEHAEPEGWARSLACHGKGALPLATPLFPRLTFPILVLAGEDDRKFRGEAAELATRLPRAHADTLPRAGHAPHLEQPAATAGRLREFWRTTEGKDGANEPADPAHRGR